MPQVQFPAIQKYVVISYTCVSFAHLCPISFIFTTMLTMWNLSSGAPCENVRLVGPPLSHETQWISSLLLNSWLTFHYNVIRNEISLCCCSATLVDFPTDIDKFQYIFNRQCSVKRSESKDYGAGSPQYRPNIIDFWERHWGAHNEVSWERFSTTFYGDYYETIEESFGKVGISVALSLHISIGWISMYKSPSVPGRNKAYLWISHTGIRALLTGSAWMSGWQLCDWSVTATNFTCISWP